MLVPPALLRKALEENKTDRKRSNVQMCRAWVSVFVTSLLYKNLSQNSNHLPQMAQSAWVWGSHKPLGICIFGKGVAPAPLHSLPAPRVGTQCVFTGWPIALLAESRELNWFENHQIKDMLCFPI